MGVKYLHTFISREVPQGKRKVDITYEIKRWKLENPGQRPVIVFDTSIALCNTFIPDCMERMCGGRFPMFHKRMRTFFDKLEECGVKMVFFMDGPKQLYKDSNYINSLSSRYVKEKKLFSILSKLPLKDLPMELRDPSQPSLYAGIESMKYIAQEYGELYMSVYYDCDKDIAKYAQDNNALAIFSLDTDFLIYPGNFKYWSTVDIRFENNRFTTFEFSRTKLRELLKLNDDQLVLLSTFCGNEVIPYEDVKYLHLTNKGNETFMEMARRVRSFGDQAFPLHDNDILRIATIIYGPKLAEERMELIRDSINFYNLNLHDYKINFDSNEWFWKLKIRTTFSIVFNMPGSTLVARNFNFEKTDFRPFHEIVQPIVERLIGIILFHDDRTKISRDFYVKKDDKAPYERIKVYAVYPPVTLSVPDMEKLFDEERWDEFNELKLKLILWTIDCDGLSLTNIKKIPKQYFIVVLTLFYLFKLDQFTLIECDSLLYTISEVTSGRVPDELEFPSQLNDRSFRVCSLFQAVFRVVTDVVHSVGYKDCYKFLDFDGVFFHTIIERMKDYSAEQYATIVKSIQNLRIYV